MYNKIQLYNQSTLQHFLLESYVTQLEVSIVKSDYLSGGRLNEFIEGISSKIFEKRKLQIRKDCFYIVTKKLTW